MIKLNGKTYYTENEWKHRIIYLDKPADELNIEEIYKFLNGEALLLVNDNYSLTTTKDNRVYLSLKGIEVIK